MVDILTSDRAKLSLGTSGIAIYEMVRAIIERRITSRGTLVDFGCGAGQLFPYVKPFFDGYVGVDAVRYDRFPKECAFHLLDFDSGRVPLEDNFADVVVGVETIEHVENPRAFFRELVRLCKPGGLVVVTTPNQLSFLSKLTLVFKNQFNAFTESSYPAHLTALLESDLRRIATECKLADLEVNFSGKGRIPKTARSVPKILSQAVPRAFSDNVAISGIKL